MFGDADNHDQLIGSILVSITPRAARLSMASCDLVVYGLRLLTILLDQFSGGAGHMPTGDHDDG